MMPAPQAYKREYSEININPSGIELALSCEGSAAAQQEISKGARGNMLHDAAVHYFHTGQLYPRLTSKDRKEVVQYVAYLRQQGDLLKGKILLEYYLCSWYEGLNNGRCDALILGDTVAKIVDLKTGDGENKILKANNNGQLKIYALFVVDRFPKIKTVVVTIYNSETGRASNVKYTRDQIYKWRDEEVLPMLNRINSGRGRCTPGAHCERCRACKTCPARISFYTQLLALYNSPEPLTREQDFLIASYQTELHNFIDERCEVVQPLIDARKIPSIYEIILGKKVRKLTEKGRQLIHQKGWTEKKYIEKDKTLGEMEAEFGRGFIKHMLSIGGIVFDKNRDRIKLKNNKNLH